MRRPTAAMMAVLERLAAGNGRIVPRQGGFWLPGDVADQYRTADERAWFERSRMEFGAKVGTATINGLAERGLLAPGGIGFERQPAAYALRCHVLTRKARALLGDLKAPRQVL